MTPFARRGRAGGSSWSFLLCDVLVAKIAVYLGSYWPTAGERLEERLWRYFAFMAELRREHETAHCWRHASSHKLHTLYISEKNMYT